MLSKSYLKFPTTEQEWKQISDEFMEQWDLPHVLGALDGMCVYKATMITHMRTQFKKKIFL